MARPPRDPSLLSWPWGSARSGSVDPSSAVGLTTQPIVNSHAESAAMLAVCVSVCSQLHQIQHSYPWITMIVWTNIEARSHNQ